MSTLALLALTAAFFVALGRDGSSVPLSRQHLRGLLGDAARGVRVLLALHDQRRQRMAGRAGR